MPKHGEAGRTVTLNKGDTFEWTNHGETPCHIDQCDPPLEHSSYDVPANGSCTAKVRDGAVSKTYDYRCNCHDVASKGNPHIIIS